MKTVDAHGTFDEAISGTSSQVEEMARQLRKLIIEIYPDVVEVPWPTQKIIGYGVGPKKMSEHFCYIAAQSKYVNLGFYYGAVLPDPEGLLEGTGKNLRHIKVKDVGMVAQPALREMIEASLDERKKTLGMAQ
jgi:hypothetical protein